MRVDDAITVARLKRAALLQPFDCPVPVEAPVARPAVAPWRPFVLPELPMQRPARPALSAAVRLTHPRFAAQALAVLSGAGLPAASHGSASRTPPGRTRPPFYSRRYV